MTCWTKYVFPWVKKMNVKLVPRNKRYECNEKKQSSLLKYYIALIHDNDFTFHSVMYMKSLVLGKLVILTNN